MPGILLAVFFSFSTLNTSHCPLASIVSTEKTIDSLLEVPLYGRTFSLASIKILMLILDNFIIMYPAGIHFGLQYGGMGKNL